MTYYGTREQDWDYRNAAWDRGCTCPMLPAHIHLVDCPLHETAEEMAARLDEEHDG